MTEIAADPFYPYDLKALPHGWAAEWIGDVAEDIQPGFASGTHNQEGVGVPHLRPMNVDREGRVSLATVKYVAPEKNALRVRPGDVLFNNTNSPELVGKTASITREEDWAFSNHMTRLRFPDSISPEFAAYQLHSLWTRGYFLRRCAHHVNQASVSSGTLATTVPLLLAPTAEQHRIVAEIEKHLTRLDAAVAALKRAQANLKRYRAAVLTAACKGRLVPAEAELARAEGREYEQADGLLERILRERRERWEAEQLAKMEASGKPPKDDRWKAKYREPMAPDTNRLPQLPEGWQWATVHQLAADEANSLTDGPFGSNLKTSHYTPDGPRVIRLQNVGDASFIDTRAHISQERYESLAKHRVEAGDLVIATLGENPPRACVIPPSVGPAIVKADCIRFMPHGELSVARYLNLALNAEPTRRRVGTLVHGVGRPRLNLSEIKSITLPLPPILEQVRIADETERRLSVVDELDGVIERSLSRAERLRQLVLKRAFEGKLVVQDPNDEPASVLLERIRAERSGMPNRKKTRRRGAKRKPEGRLPSKIGRKSLADVLASAPDGMGVSQLLHECGYTADTIDAFYAELKRELAKGRVEEIRRADSDSILRRKGA